MTIQIRKGVDQIGPGIYSLHQTKGGRVHAYLLLHDNELTLIDTLYDEDGGLVLRAIASLGRGPNDLKSIILTHAHRSHLGGLAALRDATGALVYAHDWEAPIVAGNRKAEKVGWKMQKPHNLEVWGLQLGLAAGIGAHRPAVVHGRIKHGDVVGPLSVVETPGHTPGSLTLYWPEKRALFVGDVLATWPEIEGEPLYGGWRGFTLDEGKHKASIAGLKADFGGYIQIIGVGHGDPVTQGAGDLLRLVQY
jgi:glyoxylase-like metal-dependent hydrolase (beta-lactamase superfamily II)